jgi:hypothetical protein
MTIVRHKTAVSLYTQENGCLALWYIFDAGKMNIE